MPGRRQLREQTPPPLPEEVEKKEEEELKNGPLSVLTRAVEEQAEVLISCRNNKKIVGRVRAFDRHFNMVLEQVKETWTELPKPGKGRKKSRPLTKFRFIPKLFMRGDSVILIVKNRAPANRSNPY
eukprot:TRINITY_DN765_c7_g1_i1.p3 TRINITY_DN765_c7_g1~~TRINITY_DN765_c7_g1_i1.p3  ORF type:complete len:126 (+),score=30.86 TRINITY_DN765_c7_g1_i1:126-503(+)